MFNLTKHQTSDGWYSRFRRYLWPLVFLMVLLPMLTHGQGTVDLVFNPSNSIVEAGDVFNVTIEVQAGDQLVDLAQIHVNFDKDVLQVVSLTPGNTLQNLIGPASSNDLGTIDYAGNVTLPIPGQPAIFPSGTFDLLTIEFQALADGNTSLAFQDVFPRATIVTGQEASGGSAGNVLNEAVDGSVTVGTTTIPLTELYINAGGNNAGSTVNNAPNVAGDLVSFQPGAAFFTNANSFGTTNNNSNNAADINGLIGAFEDIFQQEFFAQGESDLLFAAEITNGTYTVDIYLAEAFLGVSGSNNAQNNAIAGARIFDIEIEGSLVEDDLDLFARFGPANPAILSFPVEVTDGTLNIAFLDQGAENPKVNAIAIRPGNQAGITFPTLAAISDVNITANETETIDLSANDQDGFAFIVTNTSGVVQGDQNFVSLNGSQLVINPNGGNVGEYIVTASVFNGQGGSAAQSFNLTITEPVVVVNDPPSITEVTDQEVELGNFLLLDFLVTDDDNTTITFELIDPNNSLVDVSAFFTDNGDNTAAFNWNTANFDPGVYTATITASDNTNAPATETFQINVFEDFDSPVETVPVIADFALTPLAEGETLTVPLSILDADGDDLTVTITSVSNEPQLLQSTAPNNNNNQVDPFPTDASGFLNEENINETPGSYSSNLVFTPIFGDGGGADGDGSGSYTITVQVEDQDGNTITETFDLTVSDVPQPIAASGTTRVEAESFDNQGPANNGSGNNGIGVEVNDPGVTNIGFTNNGDFIEYEINVTQAGTYLFEFAIAKNNGIDGNLVINNGAATIAINDGTGAWQTYDTTSYNAELTLNAGPQTLRLDVESNATGFLFNIDYFDITPVEAPVNVAPIAAFTANPTSGTAPLGVSFDASASSDEDGTIASYAWDFGDGNTVTLQADTASNVYTTAGTYTATLTVTDDDGAVGTATQTITVEAAAVNNPPVIASIADVSEDEGATVSVSVSATDTDDFEDDITLSIEVDGLNASEYTFTDNGDGTASFSWLTDFNDAGAYTATVTANDGVNDAVTESFTIIINDVTTNPVALVEITPNGNLGASTFSGNGFQITNQSTGVQITQVSIDLSTGILPDMVFDPLGDGGDESAKCVDVQSQNGGDGSVGLTIPGNNGNNVSDPDCSTPFSAPRNGGFDVLTLGFNDFEPGESVFFNLDIDPNSIKDVPGAGNAGAVSGYEVVGATVTVTFSDGSTLVSSLFEMGNLGGAQAIVANNAPAAPSIAVVNVPSLPATVDNLNQTIIVTGTPGDYVALLQMDSRLFIASGDPPFNVPDETFYANEAMSGKTVYTGQIPDNGMLNIPVTLLVTPGATNTPDGGLNQFIAVTSSTPYAVDQQTSTTSNVATLLFEPALTLVASPNAFELEPDLTSTGTLSVGTTDASTPGNVVISDDADWLTVNGTTGFSINTAGLSPGPYTATLTASADGYVSATATVSLTVTSPAMPQVLVEITPNGSFGATTFGTNTIQISNQSSEGLQITEVKIDLSTGLFPDNVWDPIGEGGDATAQCLNLNNSSTSATNLGLTVPGNGGNGIADPDCSTPFSMERNGGFDVVTLSFTDFDPNEQLIGGIDVDPNSIKGIPGAGGSGAVSGLELSGATVMVTFSDGSVLMGSLYEDGSNGGGQVLLTETTQPSAPTIAIQDNPGQNVLVGETSQNLLVTGDANAFFSVLQVGTDRTPATFPIPNGSPLTGQPDFYNNLADAKTLYSGQLDGNGNATVALSLFGPASNDAGDFELNYLMAVSTNSAYVVDQPTSNTSAPLRVRVENLTTPALTLAAEPSAFTLIADEIANGTLTLGTSDASTPSGVVITDDADWLTVNGTTGFDINTAGLDPDTYTATLTASANGYENATATVSLVVNGVITSNPSAEITVTAGSGAFSSTFGNNSFLINNTGDQDITSVSINTESGILMDIVFDPVGTAGDATAKCLTAGNAGNTVAQVGLTVPANGPSGNNLPANSTDPDCLDSFSAPNNGIDNDEGYDQLNLSFTDFNPDESFAFGVDIDPTSIKNDNTAGNAGSVSGFELIGSKVTIEFADGTILTGALFDEGTASLGGAKAVIAPNAPATPVISVAGVPVTPAAVTNANQTINISGPAGATVILLQADGRLQIDGGQQDAGYDIDAFEANEIIAKQLFNVTLDGSGNASVPVTLLATASPTDGNAGPDGGLNHFIAATIGADGQIGMASNVIVLQLGEQEANVSPVVVNPGTQNNQVGDPVSLQIVATDQNDDQLTYEAQGLPPGLSINPNTGLISGTITGENNGGNGAFIEEDGIVVIEMESGELTGSWEDINSYSTSFSPNVNNPSGAVGGNFIIWQAGQFLGGGNAGDNGLITYPVQINTPGTYKFFWRNQVGNGTNTTEHNDTWLKIEADQFYGSKNGGASIVCPNGANGSTCPNGGTSPNGASGNGWFKIYSGGANNWSWSTFTSDNDAHAIFAEFDQPGIYNIQISARSNSHAIDRMVMGLTSINNGQLQNLNLPESPRANGSVAVNETYSVTVTATDNGSPALSDSETFTWNVGDAPVQNQAPTADAGNTQIVVDNDENGSEVVTLDGTGSTDDDGSIASYQWSLNGFNIPSVAQPQVTLPIGTYTITLTVTDNDGAADTDQVTVTVQAPQTGEESNFVLVNADNNTDIRNLVDGDIINLSTLPTDLSIIYVPTQSVPNVAFNLSGATTKSQTEGIAPYALNGDAGGNYNAFAFNIGQHTLTATTNAGVETINFTVVNDATVNVPPIANAGADQTVFEGETVALDGSASSDADGTIVSFAWTLNGNQIATGATPQVENLPLGANNITLTVTDNEGASATDEVLVTVNAVNQAPIANAGDDQIVTDQDGNGTETVDLDGSGSSDPDGDNLTYAWSLNGNQIATGVNPEVTLPLGENVITLTVTDDGTPNEVATAQVTITVNGLANQAPLANAGADQTVTDTDNNGSQSVTLNGLGSSDADGSIVSYAWSASGVTIPNGATPTANFPVGITLVTLTVTDNEGATATDQVSITVQPGQTGGEESNFVLVNAASDTDIRNMVDGEVINKSIDPASLSIIYEPAQSVGSVVFNLTGPSPQAQTESVAPYALNGDQGGNYTPFGFDNGSYTITATLYSASGGNGNVIATETINFTVVDQVTGNLPPTANAGPDQTVTDTDNNGSQSVTLNGLGSSDADGSIVSYAWSASGVTIPNGATPTANFPVGITLVTLTVTDNEGATATDQVSITVQPGQTGGAASADLIHATFLQGNGNPDPNGNLLRVENGNRVTYLLFDVENASNLTSAQLEMIVTSDPGNGTIQVFAGNGTGWSETGLNGGNAPSQGALLGSIGGTHSVGQTKTWNLNANALANAVINGQLTLVVVHASGNDVAFASDETDNAPTLTLDGNGGGGPSNQAPTANAGVNQSFTVPQGETQNFTLNGSGSDSDGNIVSYSWSQQGQGFVGNGQSINLTRDVGTYVFTLTVTDDDGATDTDNVTITINEEAPSNTAPVANAGNNQSFTVAQGGTQTFTLNGGGSFDNDGDDLDYDWSQQGSGFVGNGQSITLTRDAGTYVFTLTVTDESGATDTDNVTVSITEQTGGNNLQILSADIVTTSGFKLFDLDNGGTYTLPPSGEFAIEVFVSNDVESVAMDLDGPISGGSLESVAPYTVFGDNNGSYTGQSFPAGNYTLTLTPFSANFGGGSVGNTVTINFTVNAILSRVSPEASAGVGEEENPLADVSVLNAYPNPMPQNKLNVQLSEELSGEVAYTLLDASGRIVNAGTINLDQESSELALDFQSSALRQGTYYLRVKGDQMKAQTITIVKQ